jgi:hypothetical protein
MYPLKKTERWRNRAAVPVDIAEDAEDHLKSSPANFAKTVLHFCSGLKPKDLRPDALQGLPKFANYLNSGLYQEHDEVINEIKDSIYQKDWQEAAKDRPSRKEFLTRLFTRIGFPETSLEETLTSTSTEETKNNEIRSIFYNLPFIKAERVAMPTILGHDGHSTLVSPPLKILSLPPIVMVSLDRFNSYGPPDVASVTGLKEPVLFTTVHGTSFTYEPVAIICENVDIHLERYYCFKKNGDKWFDSEDANKRHSSSAEGPNDDEIISKFGSFVLYRSLPISSSKSKKSSSQSIATTSSVSDSVFKSVSSVLTATNFINGLKRSTAETAKTFVEGIIEALTTRSDNEIRLLYHDADDAWNKLDQLKKEKETIYHELDKKRQHLEIVRVHLQEEAVAFEGRNENNLAFAARAAEQIAQPLAMVPVPIPLSAVATGVSKVAFYANEILSKRRLQSAKKQEKQVNMEVSALEAKHEVLEKEISHSSKVTLQLEALAKEKDEKRTQTLGILLHPKKIPHSKDQGAWKIWANEIAKNLRSLSAKDTERLVRSGMQCPDMDTIISTAWYERIHQSMIKVALLNQETSLECIMLTKLENDLYEEQKRVEDFVCALKEISADCTTLEESLRHKHEERTALSKTLHELHAPAAQAVGIAEHLKQVEQALNAAVDAEESMNDDLKKKRMKEEELARKIVSRAQKTSELYQEWQSFQGRLSLSKNRASSYLHADFKVKDHNWPAMDIQSEVDHSQLDQPKAIDPPLLSDGLAIRLGKMLEVHDGRLDRDDIADDVFLDLPREWDDEEVKRRIDAFENYLTLMSKLGGLVGLGDNASVSNHSLCSFDTHFSFDNHHDNGSVHSTGSAFTDQSLQMYAPILSKATETGRAKVEWIKIVGTQFHHPSLLALQQSLQNCGEQFELTLTTEQEDLITCYIETDRKIYEKRKDWEKKCKKLREYKLNSERYELAGKVVNMINDAEVATKSSKEPSASLNDKVHAHCLEEKVMELKALWTSLAEKQFPNIAAMSGNVKEEALKKKFLEDKQQNHKAVLMKWERCSERYFNGNTMYWRKLSNEERVAYNQYVQTENINRPKKGEYDLKKAQLKIDEANAKWKKAKKNQDSLTTKLKGLMKVTKSTESYNQYQNKYQDLINNAEAEVLQAKDIFEELKEEQAMDNEAIRRAKQYFSVADVRKKDAVFEYHNCIKGLEKNLHLHLKKAYNYQDIGEHNLAHFNQDWEMIIRLTQDIEKIYTELQETCEGNRDDSMMQDTQQYWNKEAETCAHKALQSSLYIQLYKAKKETLALDLQLKALINTPLTDPVENRSRWGQIKTFFKETFQPAWANALRPYESNDLPRTNYWAFKIKEVQFMRLRSRENFLRKYKEFQHEEITKTAEQNTRAFEELHLDSKRNPDEEALWLTVWEESLKAWDDACTSAHSLELEFTELIATAEKTKLEVDTIYNYLRESTTQFSSANQSLKSKIASWIEQEWRTAKGTWNNERKRWVDRQNDYNERKKKLERKKVEQWRVVVLDFLEKFTFTDPQGKLKRSLRFPTAIFTPAYRKNVIKDNVTIVQDLVTHTKSLLSRAGDLSELERETELQRLIKAETDRIGNMEWALLTVKERRSRYQALFQAAYDHDVYTLRDNLNNIYKENKPDWVVRMHAEAVERIETSHRNWRAALVATERGFKFAESGDNTWFKLLFSRKNNQRKKESEKFQDWWALKRELIHEKYIDVMRKKPPLDLYCRIHETALIHFQYAAEHYQNHSLLLILVQKILEIITLEVRIAPLDEDDKVYENQTWIHKAFWNETYKHNEIFEQNKKDMVEQSFTFSVGLIEYLECLEQKWDKVRLESRTYIEKIQGLMEISDDQRSSVTQWWETQKVIAETKKGNLQDFILKLKNHEQLKPVLINGTGVRGGQMVLNEESSFEDFNLLRFAPKESTLMELNKQGLVRRLTLNE